jgi:phosphoribosylaminoimidazole-succinocarboxamide synthase
MPLRSAPKNIVTLDELSDLCVFVQDKRNEQRASAKKSRRNRHYEKQFIRNVLNRRDASASSTKPPIEVDEGL